MLLLIKTENLLTIILNLLYYGYPYEKVHFSNGNKSCTLRLASIGRGEKMKNVNLPLLLVAFLAVFCFMLVGVAIGYRSFLLSGVFLFLGFGVMGVGFTIKRKQRLSSQ